LQIQTQNVGEGDEVRFKIARIMRDFKNGVKVFLEISEKMLMQPRSHRFETPRGKALVTW
jgi:hypothetical protein